MSEHLYPTENDPHDKCQSLGDGVCGVCGEPECVHGICSDCYCPDCDTDGRPSACE